MLSKNSIWWIVGIWFAFMGILLVMDDEKDDQPKVDPREIVRADGTVPYVSVPWCSKGWSKPVWVVKTFRTYSDGQIEEFRSGEWWPWSGKPVKAVRFCGGSAMGVGWRRIDWEGEPGYTEKTWGKTKHEKPRKKKRSARIKEPTTSNPVPKKKPKKRQEVSKLNKFGWPTTASKEKTKKWYQDKYDLGSYTPKPKKKARTPKINNSPTVRYDRVARERKTKDTRRLSREERRAKLIRVMSEGRTLRGAAMDYGSKKWPFRIEKTRVFDNNRKYVGVIVFENLGSTHMISGPITDGGLRIKNDEYIVKGESSIDCRYTLSFVSDNRLEGSWHSCNLSEGPAYLNLE